MKEHKFYADGHVDRKKHRAAVVLEELINELPDDESYRAARFANHTMQQANTFIKEIKRLDAKKNSIAHLVLRHLYETIEKKGTLKIGAKYEINPKVKSLVRNIVHARFYAEIFDK